MNEASPADVEAVTRVATEYFQSWFAGDGERMRACLHPALAKRTPEELGAESLVLDERPTEVLVADTVMVRSEPFVEYLHLARFGSRWLIVNALYRALSKG